MAPGKPMAPSAVPAKRFARTSMAGARGTLLQQSNPVRRSGCLGSRYACLQSVRAVGILSALVARGTVPSSHWHLIMKCPWRKAHKVALS